MPSPSRCLENLIASLPPRLIPKDALDQLVERALANSTKDQPFPDNRRSQWEFLLRNEIFKLAEKESTNPDEPDQSYYDHLCDRLDIILSFSEHEAVDSAFLFTVLQDLLETQTVASCSHIFSWIEKHSDRLTVGMVPQKGKALILLRTLNDLLRRLSKTGNTTSFCGRILIFLSAVYPLSERSGVNLRGEYGPQWESVTYKNETVEEKMDVERTEEKVGNIKSEEAQDVEMAGQENDRSPRSRLVLNKAEEDKKGEFYNTFWYLQLPFSRPPIFALPDAFEKFKAAVNSVMPVIKEATIKERAMMGSKAVAGNLKRKRETPLIPSIDDGNRKYFFAKYLTSPDLLELEIADTSFRRQFLLQLLILLSHLLLFTKEEKQIWASPRNRSLQMDFTLQSDDAKWVQDTISRAYEELRQTAPNGRGFTDTFETVLDRERNWVRWKTDLCLPFDRAPLPISIEEDTAPLRQKMRKPKPDYEYELGSSALREIWLMGYRDLYDLENRFNPGEVKDYVYAIEKENARVKLRKQQLDKHSQKMAEMRARATAAGKPASPARSPSQGTETSTTVPPVTPVPQRAPLSAASPPLHPSLPAKPGTIAQPPVPTATSVQTPAPVLPPASTPAPIEATDPVITKAEETKQRLAWLALRLARDGYLHHFGKIGNGDIIALSQEIEKEKERSQRGESQPVNAETGSDCGATPSASNVAPSAMVSHQNTAQEGSSVSQFSETIASEMTTDSVQDVNMEDGQYDSVLSELRDDAAMPIDS